LTGLLERKVADRLGSGPGDANELKQTEFLSVLDFEQVMARRYTPEFRPPEQRDDTDVRNFDTEFTQEGVSSYKKSWNKFLCVKILPSYVGGLYMTS
jgi:hypothetical protein